MAVNTDKKNKGDKFLASLLELSEAFVQDLVAKKDARAVAEKKKADDALAKEVHEMQLKAVIQAQVAEDARKAAREAALSRAVQEDRAIRIQNLARMRKAQSQVKGVRAERRLLQQRQIAALKFQSIVRRSQATSLVALARAAKAEEALRLAQDERYRAWVQGTQMIAILKAVAGSISKRSWSTETPQKTVATLPLFNKNHHQLFQTTSSPSILLEKPLSRRYRHKNSAVFTEHEPPRPVISNGTKGKLRLFFEQNAEQVSQAADLGTYRSGKIKPPDKLQVRRTSGPVVVNEKLVADAAAALKEKIDILHGRSRTNFKRGWDHQVLHVNNTVPDSTYNTSKTRVQPEDKKSFLRPPPLPLPLPRALSVDRKPVSGRDFQEGSSRLPVFESPNGPHSPPRLGSYF